MVNSKVPREKIAWFPTINNDACIGDRECFNFCKNNVFEWDEAEGRPMVANPYKCVLGCDACMQICPVKAITFPSQQELRRMIRQAAQEEHSGESELVDCPGDSFTVRGRGRSTLRPYKDVACGKGIFGTLH
jgi:NAD-dependent dihydropyrimidine dehydrogenase PreA subunit